MEHDFRFFFNRKKQFVDVFLWDVHPTTFSRWGGGRWGYFHAEKRNPRRDKFGELHFVKNRLRIDTIVHELDHLRSEWMLSCGITIIRTNEERMACLLDELTRKFLRELRKKEPGIKL